MSGFLSTILGIFAAAVICAAAIGVISAIALLTKWAIQEIFKDE